MSLLILDIDYFMLDEYLSLLLSSMLYTCLIFRGFLYLLRNGSPGSKADFAEKLLFGISRLILSR